MTDIKAMVKPTYLDKLKELVPIYVISLVTVIASLLEAAPNALVQLIAVWILVGIAGFFTFFYEKKKGAKPIQLIFVVVSAVIWIILINFKYFSFGITTEWFIKFFVAIWTVLSPLVYEIF